MIEPGAKAPDFSLYDQNGELFRLSDCLGKKVVLYFYSRDNTSGCTAQACGFAALYPDFKAKNVRIIGISKDSTASHFKFANKHSLPFTILSDPELTVIREYGVWNESKGKSVRSTFLINEEGVVEKALRNVKASENPSQMLDLI